MLGINPLLSHTLLIQIEVKLLIIVFPPGKFRLDKHFLDATVRKQYLLQLFGPCIELVIIVAIHLDAIRTCALTNIITEALILQAIYIPATTS